MTNSAGGRKFDLFFSSEFIQKKRATLSLHESKGGAIGIPDLILTKNMINSIDDDVDDFAKEWLNYYDFHYASFQLDINPAEKFNPEWVRIHGTINPDLPVLRRATVRDLFPKTQFVDANWKIEGSFTASANIGFEQEESFMTSVGAGIKGESKISFEYKPLIAKIDSGTSGSSFHWNFRQANNRRPVGGLDVKMIIMRPRSVRNLDVIWEVAVKFDRSRHMFFNDDTARASAKTIFEFQESDTINKEP